MGAPTVSVVVPVFQGARFLAEAIESARTQTLPPVEVIVVDDGSTDDSAGVARRAAAAWDAVRVIEQPNAGPSAARNRGVAAATGELLTFLDHDDLMPPARLEQQVGVLTARPEVDLVFGRETIHVEEGVEPPGWYYAVAPGSANPLILSLMVRRAAYDRVGGFDPALRFAEDTDWFCRAAAEGLAIEADERVWLLRRLHGANATRETSVADQRSALIDVLRRRIVATRDGDDAPT